MVRRDIITETGAVAQELLNSNCDESVLYDVIVIGSGMGGGVVASALADEGKKVLVLEAGSLLFPTHVGNLPRRLQIGKFQKQIWSLYDKFTVENYDKPTDGDFKEYQGAQAFNLGGRSMFWGASIPELAQWELDAWPKSVQRYLLGEGYKKAKETFNADVPELKAFHGIATEKIQQVLGNDWTVEPAAVAVEYAGATEWAVPSGIFSTADLLIEDAMVEGAWANQGQRCPITVNLHHQAWNFCMDGDRVDGVNCFDLLAKKQRTYRAKTFVLAAGTLESTKIALQSNFTNPLIGKGVTDHPIWYRHFVIPPYSKALEGLVDLNDLEPESTKIIIRHKSATIQNHGFDIVLELGSQWNQGRFVDRDHIRDDLKTRQGYMVCEIVFQFYAELEDCNSVSLQGWNKPVKVSMKKCPTPLLLEARKIATQILAKFEAFKINDEEMDLYCSTDGWVNLEEAKVGGVAHEVGTLRMPSHGRKGVVDANLKFNGLKNLFVCDNSVFPCSPAGNPSLTLVALARRCALDVVKSIHGERLYVPVAGKYEYHDKYPTRADIERYYEEQMRKVERGEINGDGPRYLLAAWNREEAAICEEERKYEQGIEEDTKTTVEKKTETIAEERTKTEVEEMTANTIEEETTVNDLEQTVVADVAETTDNNAVKRLLNLSSAQFLGLDDDEITAVTRESTESSVQEHTTQNGTAVFESVIVTSGSYVKRSESKTVESVVTEIREVLL